MKRMSSEKVGAYQAWCQARELLYQGKYDECLEKVSWAEKQAADLTVVDGLLSTRDAAWEMQFQAAGKDQRKQLVLVGQMLPPAQATYDYFEQGFPMAAYWLGRVYERVGNLKEAEAMYRKCLKQRPSRLLWDFEAGDTFFTPVLVEGVAYAGSSDGHLRALDAKTGRLLWDFEARDGIDTPVVVNGVAYAGSDDNHLRSLDAKTGKLLWEVQAKDSVGTAAVADGVAYTVVDRTHLRAFDANTGKMLWDFEAGDDIDTPVVVDGVAYADSRGNYLRAFDAKTGKLLWDLEARDNIDTPVVVDEVAYAGWDDPFAPSMRRRVSCCGIPRWEPIPWGISWLMTAWRMPRQMTSTFARSMRRRVSCCGIPRWEDIL